MCLPFLEVLIDDPVDDQVHQPYSAFNQGFDAREYGAPKRLNPYPPGGEEWQWWNDGWEHAEGDGVMYDFSVADEQPTPVTDELIEASKRVLARVMERIKT